MPIRRPGTQKSQLQMTNRKQHGGHDSPDHGEVDGARDGQMSPQIGEVFEIRELDKDGNPTGDWIALRKTMGGLVVDRPRPDTEVSLSRKETSTMDTTAPMNPLAEILDRLATVAEKWLESQVSNEEAEKPAGDPQYLTPKEASVILRIHWQTVMEWCREGKIGSAKIGGNKVNGKGGKFLIPREAVDAYIAQRTLIHGEKRRAAK